MKEPLPKEPSQSSDNNRTLSDAHKDIEFGNNYRLEYIKHLISVSTGVVVFSVTFTKDVLTKDSSTITGKPVLVIGWLSLLLSAFAGIFHMRYWAWYYISWGTEWTKEEAKRWRSKVMSRRKLAENLQIFGFIAGLTLLTVFTILNIFK